jgi:hypothetical protein
VKYILFLILSVYTLKGFAQPTWYTGSNRGIIIVDQFVAALNGDTVFLDHFMQSGGVMTQQVRDTLFRRNNDVFEGKCFTIKNYSPGKMVLKSKQGCAYSFKVMMKLDEKFTYKQLWYRRNRVAMDSINFYSIDESRRITALLETDPSSFIKEIEQSRRNADSVHLSNFGNIPKEIAMNMDKMGIDQSEILNEYEGAYINALLVNKSKKLDCVGKKIAFYASSSGDLKIDKQAFFYSERERLKQGLSPAAWVQLCIFNNEEKQESGGYDAVIISWSKVLVTNKNAVKRLARAKKK